MIICITGKSWGVLNDFLWVFAGFLGGHSCRAEVESLNESVTARKIAVMERPGSGKGGRTGQWRRKGMG